MTPRPRTRALLAALALAPGLALAPALPVGAAQSYPDVVQLPPDFAPEGIAGGKGDTFYAGSRPGPTGGAVYRGDLRTGKGKVIVPPQQGGASIGMQFDPRTGLLWVAGGPTGALTAYDGRSGKQVARYVAPPAAAAPFVNDVDITRAGVFATDSRNARLFAARTTDGTPPARATVLPLTGDFVQASSGNSANGILALGSGQLLVVAQGELYRVDPATGAATRLRQTGGRELTGGDGLEPGPGGTAYVVYGYAEAPQDAADDSVVVVRLSSDAGSYATVRELRKDQPDADDLERPTTALPAASGLWVVNGKFGTTTTDQEVVRLRP